MPTMNQEKADELKYKIESLFEEYANFGDIKFKVSINKGKVNVAIEERRTRQEEYMWIVTGYCGE